MSEWRSLLAGSTNNLRYLDGSSVGGAPGLEASAVAVLSDTPANCTTTLRCYIKEVLITNPGKGYMHPPSVTFSGGGGSSASPAHGARGTAIISGGTVLRVEIDPLHRGISYTTPPSVHLTATRFATAYDGRVENSGHYIDPAATTAGGLSSEYKHVGNGVTPNSDTIGHGTWNLDQTAASVHQGEYKQTSNYMVGHGAFPGHPGNQNLGHPRKDCIYFLYSDIYVSPSGSDSTGQGTAGRPYRTVQKCVDAALAGARDFYVYKKMEGGDRDPRVPDGTTRYGTESAGERMDATGSFDDGKGRETQHVVHATHSFTPNSFTTIQHPNSTPPFIHHNSTPPFIHHNSTPQFNTPIHSPQFNTTIQHPPDSKFSRLDSRLFHRVGPFNQHPAGAASLNSLSSCFMTRSTTNFFSVFHVPYTAS